MTRKKEGAVIGRPSVSEPGTRTPTVSFRLPQSLIDEIKMVAEERDCSPSDVFREACEQVIARHKRQKKQR